MIDKNSKYCEKSELLWSTEVLKKKLDTCQLSIIDTRPAEAFSEGHIPGAKHFDLYFVNIYDTNQAPLASFRRMWADLLGWRGVSQTDTIIFVGEFSDMVAARGFWFAEYLGSQDVHVLDGGMRAWIASGNKVNSIGVVPQPVKFEYAAQKNILATYKSTKNSINDPNSIIIDNRSLDEFMGFDKRAPRGGSIPSAIHLDWEELYDHETGQIKCKNKLFKIFQRLNVTPEKDITLYCNTGYRSAHAYLALRLLNYPHIRNYVGSWQEWGARKDSPIINES